MGVRSDRNTHSGQETDPKVLADLARGRLRRKIPLLEKALQGKVEEHQNLILSQLLTDIDLFDEQISGVSVLIEQRVSQDQELIDRLDKIPGVNRRTSEVVLAELGTDMSRFPNDCHAAAWAGLCPSNKESGGHPLSRREEVTVERGSSVGSEFQRQKRRKPKRCQGDDGLGLEEEQSLNDQTRRRQIQSSRSTERSLGLRVCRLNTMKLMPEGQIFQDWAAMALEAGEGCLSLRQTARSGSNGSFGSAGPVRTRRAAPLIGISGDSGLKSVTVGVTFRQVV